MLSNNNRVGQKYLFCCIASMQALRTRSYSSTRFINHTFRRVGLSPTESGGRSSFQPPTTGERAAHLVHCCSDVHSWVWGKDTYAGQQQPARADFVPQVQPLTCQPVEGKKRWTSLSGGSRMRRRRRR